MNDAKILFQNAFRQAVSADYSFIPEEENIDHSFSAGFLRKSERIKVRENYFMPKTKKIVAVAAAIIVFLALAGCSVPSVREGVKNFFIATYEHTFGILWKPDIAAETLDVIYEPSYKPAGFREISREAEPERIRAVYERNQDNSMYAKIIFSQTLIPEDGLYLGKGGCVYSVESDGITAHIYEYPGYTLVYSEYGGYLFSIECRGDISSDEALKMIASLEKTDS